MAKVTIKKTDRDKGWDDILTAIQELDGAEVHSGILGDAGQDIVDRATFNEFGTRHIPERSFIRSTFDENRKDYERQMQADARTLGQGGDADLILNRAGLRATADIQKKITELRDPPNEPATIARKGSSNPLIDSSRMRQSVNYEIKK